MGAAGSPPGCIGGRRLGRRGATRSAAGTATARVFQERRDSPELPRGLAAAGGDGRYRTGATLAGAEGGSSCREGAFGDGAEGAAWFRSMVVRDNHNLQNLTLFSGLQIPNFHSEEHSRSKHPNRKKRN